MTTTAIDVRQPSAALAVRPDQEMWTREQRAALQALGIRGATNADLAVFMHYCQKTGLDPFSRQIYMINRREKHDGQWVDKQTIQVGIDGFRVIRDRICRRDGIDVEYEDTCWYDADGGEHWVWLGDEPPAACRVVVLKDGKRFPAVLRTAAYAAKTKDGDMAAQWRTQPDHMIEKCCEAFALRRAFPHDLGGIYIEEELPPQHDAPARPRRAPAERVTAAEITRNTQDSPPREGTAAAAGTPPPDTTTGSPGPVQDGGHPAGPHPTPPGDGPAGPTSKTSRGLTGVIQRHFQRLGFGPEDREERLAFTAHLAGVPDGVELKSTSHLSEEALRQVADALAQCRDRTALVDLIHGGGEPA